MEATPFGDQRNKLTTTALAQVLEPATEADLVEAVLGAVDPRPRLVRVPDLGIRLHREVAFAHVREDLPLLEPGLEFSSNDVLYEEIEKKKHLISI